MGRRRQELFSFRRLLRFERLNVGLAVVGERELARTMARYALESCASAQTAS